MVELGRAILSAEEIREKEAQNRDQAIENIACKERVYELRIRPTYVYFYMENRIRPRRSIVRQTKTHAHTLIRSTLWTKWEFSVDIDRCECVFADEKLTLTHCPRLKLSLMLQHNFGALFSRSIPCAFAYMTRTQSNNKNYRVWRKKFTTLIFGRAWSVFLHCEGSGECERKGTKTTANRLTPPSFPRIDYSRPTSETGGAGESVSVCIARINEKHRKHTHLKFVVFFIATCLGRSIRLSRHEHRGPDAAHRKRVAIIHCVFYITEGDNFPRAERKKTQRVCWGLCAFVPVCVFVRRYSLFN